jgi:ribosomal protein S18 acetylase RimI-like enzyme
MSPEAIQVELPDRKRLEREVIRPCGKHVRTYFEMRYLDDYYRKGTVWRLGWVGFAVAVPLKRSEVTSLYEFGIVPEFRGLGMARKLLKAVNVGRPLRLVVSEDNVEAHDFYLRCGLHDTSNGPVPNRAGSQNIVWKMEGMPT